MRFDVRVAVALALAILVEACEGSSTPTDVAGADGGGSGNPDASNAGSDGDASNRQAGRVPANHRPSDAQCATPAPAGDCSSTANTLGDAAACLSDSTCTAGTNGRCLAGSHTGCFCTDDICIQDSDCARGETCACHGSPYIGSLGNFCVQGNCRVDADCGGEGYCSPSVATTSCGSLVGYFCHTAADLCTDDSDCESQNGACMHSPATSRWECESPAVGGCPQ